MLPTKNINWKFDIVGGQLTKKIGPPRMQYRSFRCTVEEDKIPEADKKDMISNTLCLTVIIAI